MSRRILLLGCSIACLLRPVEGPGAVQDAAVEGQPLEIDERPLLTLGAAEGAPAQEFDRVSRPFMLPGGRVVVPSTGHGEIRVFDLKGDLVATHGRAGEGPGEFRALDRAWSRGDTIEAFDGRSRRITRFFPDGAVETLAVKAGGPELPGVLEGFPGVFGDGWALSGVTGAEYGARDEVSVFRFARDGSVVARIATVAGFFRYSGAGFNGPAPLSPRPQIAARGDTLYVGETLTPAIRVVDDAGEAVREITWVAERPSASDVMPDVIRRAVEQAAPDRKEQVRERLEAAPEPRAVPVFSAMLVDDEGFVWIRPYEPGRDAYAVGGPLGSSVSGPGGMWWIFTAAGERVGAIQVPPGFEPSHISADVVVGIRRDELDLEYVQVHRLHRR